MVRRTDARRRDRLGRAFAWLQGSRPPDGGRRPAVSVRRRASDAMGRARGRSRPSAGSLRQLDPSQIRKPGEPGARFSPRDEAPGAAGPALGRSASSTGKRRKARKFLLIRTAVANDRFASAGIRSSGRLFCCSTKPLKETSERAEEKDAPSGRTDKKLLPNPRGVSDLRQRRAAVSAPTSGVAGLGSKTGAGVSAKMAGTFVPELLSAAFQHFPFGKKRKAPWERGPQYIDLCHRFHPAMPPQSPSRRP